MEGEIGRFRRRHLVPVPRVGSLAELNEVLAAADRADDDRRIGRRPETVGEAFAAESSSLGALPDEGFECWAELSVKVDAKARISVRQSHYSVPARLSGRRVAVRLHAAHLEAVCDGKVVTVHHRSLHKGTEELVLDHYLEVLERKPGALPGSVALAQARASGAFSGAHEQFWAEAASGWATAPAPGPCARCCCCTGPCPPTSWPPPSTPPWPSPRSTPRWWPSRPAAWPTPARRPR